MRPSPSELARQAAELRGVVAARVVGRDGEVLASAGADEALSSVGPVTLTSALAAAEALASTMTAGGTQRQTSALPGDPEPDEAHIMLLYQPGRPVLFSPVANDGSFLVVAVTSEADVGRARFGLKRLAAGA